MAQNGAKRRDSVAILLARGVSVTAAAEKSGVGRRTITRWLAEHEFQGEIQRLRSELMNRATAQVAGTMTRAATRLRKLLASTDEQVALRAARAILELGPKLRDAGEIEDRLTKLEKLLLEPKTCKLNVVG
jgi:transposase